MGNSIAGRSVESWLGDEAKLLLDMKPKIPKEQLHLPGPNWVSRSFTYSDRNVQTIRSLQTLYNSGRLADTGYLSIFPVDQGIEHSAGASFAVNPMYFDSENIIRLAYEAGCNAVASTLGVMASVSRKYAHKIPFVLKLNHNEILSSQNSFDQTMFTNVKEAWNLGAVAVGATIYFGSAESRRQITEISDAFSQAHDLGMATILWCYTRNDAFKQDKDYHLSADLTGQANHLGVTIKADIIKQKLPELNGGYAAVAKGTGKPFGKSHPDMYKTLCSDNPIDLTRYQVLNCYAGRISLINSGGASGDADLQDAIRTAIINKRAGGAGLILGRKAFQKPFQEGVDLLQAVQDVYIASDITIA